MKDTPLTVLLISNAAADVRLIRQALSDPIDDQWRVERVRRLGAGVKRLRTEGVAAVLLDLSLPDSQGIQTFDALFEAAPLIPILVLANLENEDLARQATQRGAQECLLTDHLDAYWLPRMLRSAIARKIVPGMVVRGARVYAANGCVYCHSQQVRPEYGGSDIERHWGERRSAPRDYIFEPIVFLGEMRIGPDLANVGHQPAVEENKAAMPPSAPAAAHNRLRDFCGGRVAPAPAFVRRASQRSARRGRRAQ
jgi:CheY-like chemotaxis protein